MPAARSRDRATETRVKPRSDAYVGLLALSLLALSAALLFAFLNWQGISEKPKPVQMAPAGGGRMAPTGPGLAPPPAGPNMAPPGAAVPPGGQQGGAPLPGQPGGNPPPAPKQ
jgi:hypothetical protein